MRFRLRTLLIVLVIAHAVLLGTLTSAHAVIVVSLEVPHDDLAARQTVKGLDDLTGTAVLIALVEPLAVADRSKRVELRFPNNYGSLTREQIERRLGKPSEWKVADYARPVAGDEMLFPRNARPAEAADLMTRARFYAYKDVGGILILFSEAGVAHSPGVIYLRTDTEFVPLRRPEDGPKRLAWERPKLENLRQWLGIPETVVKNADGQWQVQPKPE